MSKFVELFKKYGYTVEPFGKSYIADNGTFCIPFTEIKVGDYPAVSAVSFLSCDKKNIKKRYAGEEYIGCKIFSDWTHRCLSWHQFGGICNHDHSFSEIEAWLSISRRN